MSVEERKRSLEIAIDAAAGRAQTIMSCSDQNIDVVMDLAKHAERAGADYIVVHARQCFTFDFGPRKSQ
ncbi:dihydrodipicolinate synthase family protein [Mesorhizobium escarrei]|uniref:dihydrodipicolinate synthase family protein n=1 Tax=Mesorhizobium escarrei TaxID=666018 RepID=UPI0020A81FE7|nr:hypothetical protein [Mesorhizobium escarrei]